MSNPLVMSCPRCWGSKIELGRTDRNCTLCTGTGIVADTQLTKNFRLSELVRSPMAVRKRLENDPNDIIEKKLLALAIGLLEPIRDLFGPIYVSSGYRSPAVNRAVGGATSSAHLYGHAADIEPLESGVHKRDIIEFLAQSSRPFDQVIYEGTWVHVALFNGGGLQRRQVLMMFPDSTGKANYLRYDPKDPRVIL